jgi:hypothetical protein
MMIFVNVCSTWNMDQLKTCFASWITRNHINGVSIFNLSHLIKLMAYLCSQWTRNVQMKYFMFDWSIYSLFVLNRCWKLYSHQIMIFVNGYSTWGIFELKTHFGNWITRNDVNGVSFFHLSYLVTLMAYLCSQSTPNNYFVFHE